MVNRGVSGPGDPTGVGRTGDPHGPTGPEEGEDGGKGGRAALVTMSQTTHGPQPVLRLSVHSGHGNPPDTRLTLPRL